MDKLIRTISENGEIKLTAITLRATVERARQIHQTLPVATAALGRAMSAASMLGARIKEPNGSLTLRINGGGPLGTIMVVSDPSGNVRGYVQNPAIDLPKRPDGKLAVGEAVGREGLLTITKDLGFGDPYVGSTTLVSGEIAEDLAAYYVESEQTGAAVALGVLVDRDQSVLAAGGYIVELLPGASDDALFLLEQNIASTGPVTDTLKDHGPEALAEKILAGFNPIILEEHPIEYRCYCSRDRVTKALIAAGESALQEMATAGEDTLVTCQFCDQTHRFTPTEIAALLQTGE